MRDLSYCVINKFNGYNILKAEIKDEEKKVHQPIDIVYVPIKNSNEIINCYFTDNLHLAYRSYCTRKKGDETIEKLPARQCYYCDKYFTNLSKFNTHAKCSDIAGIVYTFEHKNIISFQDNFKHLGDC